MKELLLILSITLPFIGFGQDENYEGEWSASGEEFKNTMMLEKVDGKEDLYKFSFFGWRNSYDTYARQIIKFSGTMTNDVFVIEVKDNEAHYNDHDLQVLDEELPLYCDGEERCNVYFRFDKETIKVRTEFCNMIYGGFGVSFDGTYKK